MPTGVFGQVVTTHEAAVAHIANKLFLTSVRPAVAGELIGSGKPFVAAVPVTAEWLLTCRGRGGTVRGRHNLSDHDSVHGPNSCLTHCRVTSSDELNSLC